jgi:hypothetical protein
MFEIEVMGEKTVIGRMEYMEAAAMDMQPALEEIGFLIMNVMRKMFESGGRRGGGSWAPDDLGWLARKIMMGLDPRVGIATEALMRAFTQPEAPHQEYEVGSHSLHLSSDLSYAAAQQTHRPFVKFTYGDRTEMGNIVRRHLIHAWNAGGEK